MVIREQVVWGSKEEWEWLVAEDSAGRLREGLTDGGLVADVFKQDAERLQELKADVAAGVLGEGFQEEGLHVLLQEEAVEEAKSSCRQQAMDSAVVTVSKQHGTMDSAVVTASKQAAWHYGLSSGDSEQASSMALWTQQW